MHYLVTLKILQVFVLKKIEKIAICSIAFKTTIVGVGQFSLKGHGSCGHATVAMLENLILRLLGVENAHR